MDIFSNLMAIGECLLDTRRTSALQRAIKMVVKQGDTVMDVGTGSAILAMFAAKAGAKKIYAIEITPEIAEFARTNVRANNLTDKVEVITSDIKRFNFPHNIDVLIMELMDTWMVAEQQAVALNTLRDRGIISSETKLIPYRYQSLIGLAEYDFNFYDLSMPFVIQARNFAADKHIQKYLSKVVIFNDIDLRKKIETDIDLFANVTVGVSGTLNALVLKAKINLTPTQTLMGTTDLNMPVIVPIDPIGVKSGQVVSVHVKYAMGEGFDKFKATAKLIV